MSTRTTIVTTGLVLLLALAIQTPLIAQKVSRGMTEPPAWAYAITPPPPPGAPRPAPEPEDKEPKRIPGATQAFTVAQIEDLRSPADWFPGDHPAMPPIVATGRQPGVRACAYCHYPNGKGRPSNGGVSGQPVSYFIQTLNDFKNGLRKPGDPQIGRAHV